MGNGKAKAIKSAARTQEQALNQIRSDQKDYYAKTQELLNPFMETSNEALTLFRNELNTPLEQTAGYQFQRQEAERALQARLAGQGKLGSGEAIRRDINLSGMLTSSALDRRNQLIGQGLNIGQNALSTSLGIEGQNFQNNASITSALASNKANSRLALAENSANVFNRFLGAGTSAFGFLSGNPGSVFQGAKQVFSK